MGKKGSQSGAQSGSKKQQPTASKESSSAPSYLIYVLAGIALLAAYWTQAKKPPPQRDAADTSPVELDEEDTKPTSKSGPAYNVSNKFWTNSHSFKSRHILEINTLNFNETVTDPKRGRVLIAFYDRRSRSYKDLVEHLDETADQLAALEQDGQWIGQLGACNIAVDAYLGSHWAPEMFSSWQEARKGGYKFGRPNFFPMILVYFAAGERLGEYQGVVSAKHIIPTMRRLMTPRGGSSLDSAEDVRQLLQGTGPVVLGCGVENGTKAFTALNETAHSYHFELVFGYSSASNCQSVLGQGVSSGASPHVVWARGEGLSLDGSNAYATFNMTQLENSTYLVRWLLRHREELLEEITPDNSHKYLSIPKPLSILLVKSSERQQLYQGEQLFSAAKGDLNKYQLTYADCDVFAKQFGIDKNECPALLLVNPADVSYTWINMEHLQRPPVPDKSEDEPWTSTEKDASARLISWMENKSATWRSVLDKFLDDDEGPKEGEDKDESDEDEAPKASAPKNETEKEPRRKRAEGVPLEVQHEELRSWQSGLAPDVLDTSTTESLFIGYHDFLHFMFNVKESYEKRYSHMPFDFSELKEVQKMHKQMVTFAQDTSKARRLLEQNEARDKLWKAIEKREEFLFNRTWNSSADKALHQKLLEATRTLHRLYARLMKSLHEAVTAGKLGVKKPAVKQVDRRDAGELSVKAFIEEYAKPGRPVIITGLDMNKGANPWTLEFFRDTCNKSVRLTQRNRTATTWGGLIDVDERLRLPEFIQTFTSNSTRRQWYVHDWSLPRHCPEAFGPPPYKGFSVPKYFVGDYFQRAPLQGYQHTWPSLFVGSGDTESAMHIDSGGTNFWLYLYSGKKEWRFFSRFDFLNLCPKTRSAHFHVDVFRPDVDLCPLFEYAEMFQGIQGPGELFFIPGGNPHGVRNLEDIHGISMNYVDASNVDLYLYEMIHSRSWKSIEMFTDGTTFPHGLQQNQTDLSFGEWKSANWRNLHYDLH
eukprot:TRINITY_DN92713_c0_g1_i1.p1 TRINITY_DN92713_c0_g1~~TRINITY_DN92713_c0_g1_i1.p1  ORF type:complete len:990 (+),score=195.39 TRINITY_DN92713_c0_g1_i1:41-3010(+)